MANIRHVVVVRKDLQLSPGLLAAQVSHISDNFMREKILKAIDGVTTTTFNKNEIAWFRDPYLSVLAVNCLEDLEAVRGHAIDEQLRVYDWHDTIPSPTFQDRAIRAFVGLSIGPDDFDKIKIVTSSLQLY